MSYSFSSQTSQHSLSNTKTLTESVKSKHGMASASAASLVRIDWKARLLQQDRLSVLTDIIKTSVINLPFQNITSIAAIDIDRRRAIILEDVLASGLTGCGGLCGHINTFLHCLLKSLGYDSSLIAGSFRRTGIPGSHVLCKVNLLEKHSRHSEQDEDWYIVDAGASVAIHEPIRISKLPYLGRAGGLNFRYERLENGIIQRVHENGDALLGHKPKNYLCPQDYTIDPTPVRHFHDFAEPIACFYRSTHLPVHHSLFCFRYLSISDSDFELIWLRGTELVRATRETRTVTSYENYYDLHPVILKYFPMIDQTQVDSAVERLQKKLQESKYKSVKV